MQRPAAGALAVAAALVLSGAALLAAGAPTPPVPQVTVRLDDVPPVDVDGATDTEVTVNGTVNITVPSFVPVQVALNVSILAAYWPATVEPQRSNITGSGDVPLNGPSARGSSSASSRRPVRSAW